MFFFVVINHSIYVFNKYGEVSIINWMTSNVIFFISKMAVPLFVIMTGALILDEEESYKRVFINRFLRFGLILFIWSAICFSFYKGRMLNINDIIFMIKEIIKRPISTHFWYLYMPLGLYLMTPFIRKMIKNFNREDYLFYFMGDIFNISTFYEDFKRI